MEAHVVIQRHRIQYTGDIATLEQRRQRRGEAQALAGTRQIQRLDAETVAGDEQLLRIALPDGKGEHAVQSRQQRFAPGMEALEQNFGIAFGEEAITQAFQLCAQFRVVVDGAIEDHRQAEGRVDHRLAGGLAQIHDLQTSMTQGKWALTMKTARVGAARSQMLGDAFNRSQIGRAVIETKFSSYATHKILTGFAVGECDWPVTREVQPFGSAQRRRCGRV